jgi:hypothetical protein
MALEGIGNDLKQSQGGAPQGKRGISSVNRIIIIIKRKGN